jgi:type IV pilus assembly protein PilW
MKILRKNSAAVQGGFTLIELMVASVIGLIVLLAVSYAFIGGRRTYVLNSELMRMQENARAALEAMQRDVRMAAFHGCAEFANLSAGDGITEAEREYLKQGVRVSSAYGNAIAGMADGATSMGLEIHGVRANGGEATVLEEFVPNKDAKIAVQGGVLAHELEVADYANARVLVSDCSEAVILKQTGANVPEAVSKGEVGVSGGDIEHLFARGAQVFRYPPARAFLVRENPDDIYEGATSPIASLYYNDVGGLHITDVEDMEELASGVEAFRVCVIDEAETDVSKNPLVQAEDKSKTMERATRVQIDLVLVSRRPEVLPEAAEYEMRLCGETTADAVSYTKTDRRLRRLFSTTATMRNKVDEEAPPSEEAHDSAADAT